MVSDERFIIEEWMDGYGNYCKSYREGIYWYVYKFEMLFGLIVILVIVIVCYYIVGR